MIGHTVGSYKITEKIGEGGMGAVFKGIDVMLDREVAIKMLRPELARQAQLAERFRSEAVTLARLNHPNIATLYSFLRQNDDFFMVMEYVRGETFEQVMRRGPMNCDTAVSLFCHALDGMEHAHGMNIIHRDIKPANIMLTDRGSIKVMDFGIARVLGTDRMTRAGHLVGTIEYMPPEQVRGAETDARSDIYSLGILLYEMVTGRVPFTSPSEFDLMRAQVEDPPPPPREFAPLTPVEIEQSILRALAKNKDDRFQTAAEFRQALLTGNNAPVRSFSSANVAANQAADNAQPQHIKETRLAPAAAAAPVAPIPVAQMKATRLAPQNQPQPSYAVAQGGSQPQYSAPGDQMRQTMTAAPSPSFLDRLNWKHYAGAGVALFVFVAVLVGAPLGLFLSSRSGAVQPEKEEVKPTPAPRPSAIPTVAPAFILPPQPVTSQPPQTGDRDSGGDGSSNGSSNGSRSANAPPRKKAVAVPSRAANPPPRPAPTPPPVTVKKEEEKKEKKRGFFGKLKDKVPGIKLP